MKGAKKYDLNDGVVCEDDPNCREFTIFIPEYNYATPKHLIDEIQYSLDLLLKERLKAKFHCHPARCLLPVEIMQRCGLATGPATVELLPYLLPY